MLGGLKMKNVIAGYRTMLGYTQQEMAEIFGITRQAYGLKENGHIQFNDKEKVIFKDLVKKIVPTVSIDDIFFSQNAKKCKEVNNLKGVVKLSK